MPCCISWRWSPPCSCLLYTSIRIGQGIEFDYCSVHCVWTLKKHGCEAILVNNTPETVSTDFDTGARLSFDPLNPESVDNILATEKPDACVVQFGGQTALKLAKHMDEIGQMCIRDSCSCVQPAVKPLFCAMRSLPRTSAC